MEWIDNILFIILLAAAVFLFTRNVKTIARNINLGKDTDRSDRAADRWKLMFKVALGQSKMVVRPVPGILHLIVYIGFILINIEVLEILIDGIFGTHRVLSFMGPFYNFLIGFFEVLAFLVLSACVIFLVRRNILKLKRFSGPEMTRWPLLDANIILSGEIILMAAILVMNGSDYALQQLQVGHYIHAGSFPISSSLSVFFNGMSASSLIAIERSCWWLHIIGILAYLNYIPFSKHFHIVLAFPNVYFSNLEPKGEFTNLASVTQEVKLMMDPNAAPPADTVPTQFGAKDVKDLSWVQLMNAYSCTECGRCTSNCPANQTGKLLSPRKIMMDTRDRLEEVGKNIQTHGTAFDDGKSLLGNYITPEELWACTTCNACTEACPVNIDPLSIIMDLRRYMVMEQSAAPVELNGMFSNIENNGAPWQFSPADRLKWAEENS
jgi:heterodisulfide reductase subunit C